MDEYFFASLRGVGGLGRWRHEEQIQQFDVPPAESGDHRKSTKASSGEPPAHVRLPHFVNFLQE